jgi:outer membrane lipoprotein-sorting protein
MRFLLPIFFTLLSYSSFSQTGKGINDPEASALLKQVSDKYKSYKNVSATFKLLIQKPKVKPTDDERKLTDTLAGNAIIEGAKFNVQMNGQQTFCDGKKHMDLHVQRQRSAGQLLHR